MINIWRGVKKKKNNNIKKKYHLSVKIAIKIFRFPDEKSISFFVRKKLKFFEFVKNVNKKLKKLNFYSTKKIA